MGGLSPEAKTQFENLTLAASEKYKTFKSIRGKSNEQENLSQAAAKEYALAKVAVLDFRIEDMSLDLELTSNEYQITASISNKLFELYKPDFKINQNPIDRFKNEVRNNHLSGSKFLTMVSVLMDRVVNAVPSRSSKLNQYAMLVAQRNLYADYAKS